jgi:hypothetical protein
MAREGDIQNDPIAHRFPGKQLWLTRSPTHRSVHQRRTDPAEILPLAAEWP